MARRNLPATSINSIDTFLQHKTSDRSGGFLSKWRKKDQTSKLDVWLHRKRFPVALWQHQLPRLFVKTDKDTGENVTLVWTQGYNCHESEKVLKKQYHRKDDGTREYPPEVCPVCRLIETIRDMVEEGQLDWTKVVFRFQGDKDIKLIHAGGIYGGFNAEKDDLTAEEKLKLRNAGISLKDSWQENAMAKCNYVFCVVDNANIGSGVQIATETALLGDKVKEVMNDSIESLGAEDGNPFIKPYCIQWEHRPSEQEFQKRYKARRMEKYPLTAEIDALISGEPPDISQVIKPFNMKTMRAFLERHCMIKDMPWDHIFEGMDEAEEDEKDAAGEFPPRATGGTDTSTGDHDDGEDMCPLCGLTEEGGCLHVQCDAKLKDGTECGAPILQTAAKCDACGHVYRQEPPPTPAPIKRGRKRSAVESGDKIP
jgi:hypothetical protein